MFAPRAGSSRGLVVAEPAAATRTSLFGLPCILTQINLDCLKKSCFPSSLFVITTENATWAKLWERAGECLGKTSPLLVKLGFYCNWLFQVLIWVGLRGEKLSRVGQEVVGLSMIGECRWVLQCFPYRHWTSSPPLKAAAAAASPATSCTQPQFSSGHRCERGYKMR